MSRTRTIATSAAAGATATMTLTLSAAEYTADVTLPTTPEDVPPLSELLLSLDGAARSDAAQSDLVRTLRVLLMRAEMDAKPAAEYLRLAILVAFRRRHHDKAQAPGSGPGEKRMLRTLLIEAYNADPALVRAVLPLVPFYGSWRDLQVMAEVACPPSSDSENVSVTLPPIAMDIAAIFSQQLRRDTAEMEKEKFDTGAMDVVVSPEGDKSEGGIGNNSPTTEGEAFKQSNACKYAPHEFRHRRRGRRTGSAVKANRVQRKLGDTVAELLFRPTTGANSVSPPPLPPHIARPRYRKVLSQLNARLAAKGFLVEPLLCRKRTEDIDFRSAAKGALAKYRTAIIKNPEAAQKWRQEMKSSDAAVPDLDSLQEFARNLIEDLDLPEEEQTYARRLVKAVKKSITARKDLLKKVDSLLRQLQGSEGKGKFSSEVDTDAKALLELLQQSTGIVSVPVVDSASCNQQQFLCLFTEAYIAAASQGISFIIIDGTVYDISVSNEVTNEAVAPDPSEPKRDNMAVITDKFRRAVSLSSTLDQGIDGTGIARSVRTLEDLQRLRRNCVAALVHYREAVILPSDGESPERCDVLYFTATGLPNAAADPVSYSSVIDELQQLSSAAIAPPIESISALHRRPAPMRALLLHKLTAAMNAEVEEIPLVLRHSCELPSNRMEITLDLVLVMDLTGSMGSWMEQAKAHLEQIVQALRSDTDIGGIRIAFIGYRDYQDTGRLVHHPFVPMHQAREAMEVLRRQSPSGGGDLPEDVLIAYTHALNSLSWESHLRVMLHVADAPAHGYHEGSGDSFRFGRCPDQLSPHLDLPETLRNLADNLDVNLLFCRLNKSTRKMEAMFAEIYNHGPGFGVLPMTAGAAVFKDAVISTLSTSLLKALAPTDINGLQSFSGGSASALISTLLSSMRETISVAVAKMSESTSTGNDDDTSSSDMVGRKRMAKDSITDTAARSDFIRLMTDINSLDELMPVRMALGMLEERTMQEKAATVLLENGLTVSDLVSHGYPDAIIAAVRDVGLKRALKL